MKNLCSARKHKHVEKYFNTRIELSGLQNKVDVNSFDFEF